MHLAKAYKKFNSRCFSYKSRADEIYLKSIKLSKWEFNYLTEVLLSDMWQSWCKFNRTMFLSSCWGTKARNGDLITGIAAGKSWQRLCYEAKQSAFGNNTTPQGHLNFLMRKEPTWGDLDVFLRIISRVQPSNEQQLSTAYGSFHNIKQLQLIRNACAHKNQETFLDVKLLNRHYSGAAISRPTEVAWKFNPAKRALAVDIWLYEMRMIADLATSTT